MSVQDEQVENAVPTSKPAQPEPAVTTAAAPAAEGRDRTALMVGATALLLTLSAPYWTPTVYSSLNLRPHGIEWQARQQVETGRLSQTVAEMDRRLSEISTLIENAKIEAGKVQDIGGSVTAQLDAAMLLQFRAVIRQPVAFDAELKALRAILPPDEEITSLVALIEPYASTGVPQTGQLFREMSSVINAVARTDQRPSVMGWLNSLAAWPQDLLASSGLTSLNLPSLSLTDSSEPAADTENPDLVEAAPAEAEVAVVATEQAATEAVAAGGSASTEPPVEAAPVTEATTEAATEAADTTQVEAVQVEAAQPETAPTEAVVAEAAPVEAAPAEAQAAVEAAPVEVAAIEHSPVAGQPIAERARQQLAANDLAGAVATLETLEGEAAQAARWWLDQARARLAADRLSDRLAGIAVSVLSRVQPRS